MSSLLAQILIAFGAVLMGILGAIHIVYTFFTNKFDARDAATSAAMKATSMVLTRRTSLWNAWIGFNASHALGILLFAATYLVLAIGHLSVLHESQHSLGCRLQAARHTWRSRAVTGSALHSLAQLQQQHVSWPRRLRFTFDRVAPPSDANVREVVISFVNAKCPILGRRKPLKPHHLTAM